MDNSTSVYDSVCCIVKEIIEKTDVIVNNETNLIEEGLLSSLKLVEMIIKLEEHFSIEFDTFSMNTQNFATIARIFETICSELQKKQHGG